MPARIKNLNQGVRVLISPHNARAINKILIESGRSFSREVNQAVGDYIYRKIYDNTNITKQNADEYGALYGK